MAFSRYTRDSFTIDGKGFGPPRSLAVLRSAIADGTIPIVKTLVTTQSDRLDTLSGALYGDGRYWWVLAAASNIGWGMQVPPGIFINVPDLKAVERIVG